MTDGTSQGLFIVVAIVIFGIFVVLAYILFEDTLSPAMASMFNEAIEQAEFNASNQSFLGILDLKTAVSYFDTFTVHTFNRNKLIFSGDKHSLYGSGVYIDSSHLEPNKKYRWTFDLKVLEGQLFNMGGHSHVSSKKDITINGETFETVFSTIPYNFENNKTYTVQMDFLVDRMVIKENGVKKSTTETEADIFFQPNRSIEGEAPYKLEITNMKFYELKSEE